MSWHGFTWFQCLAFLIGVVNGYNVDVNSARVFAGPVNNSLFGFSSTIFKVGNDFRVLTGAPYEKNRTGAAYWYSVVDGQNKYTRVYERSNWGGETPWGRKSEDDELFGIYVGHSTKNGLICAPRWADVKNTGHSYQLLGRCVSFQPGMGRMRRSIELYYSLSNQDYFVRRAGGSVYIPLNAVAELGMAGDLNQKGDFLIGAPGRKAWKGGFAFTEDQNLNDFEMIDTPEEVEDFSYLGYAVVFGKFSKSSRVCWAAGAPRKDLSGSVLVYERMSHQNFSLLANVTSEQIGSYFGAAVCAADVNGDGLDDLLVGAPYFTEDYTTENQDRKTAFADEGRVFVYINMGLKDSAEGERFKLTAELFGSNTAHARFGTAIGNLGDQNYDRCQDVAVGAPFENDGSGAVYIYHGSRQGFPVKAAQRITAKDIDSSLKGFGWHVTKPVDVDSNEYEDFAIGSVMSDNVVLFRTRPILDLVGNLTVIPSLIIPNNTQCSRYPGSDSCFVIRLCFSYIGKSLPSQAEVKYGLALDTEAKSGNRRIKVNTSTGFQEALSGKMNVMHTRGSCEEFMAISLEAPRIEDPFTNVFIDCQFNLTQPVLPSSEIQPIANSSRPTTIRTEAGFSTGCRRQTVCEADLALVMQPRFASGEDFIIVNKTKLVELELLVTNMGESAYGAALEVNWAGGFRYIDTISSRDNPMACEKVDDSNRNYLLRCEFQKQVPENSRIPFTMIFNATDVDLANPEAQLMAQVTTISQEMNALDNAANVTLPIWIVARANITGVSDPTLVPLKSDQLTEASVEQVSHKYSVVNAGPSYLPSTVVTMEIPYYTMDWTELLSQAEAQVSFGDGTSEVCGLILPISDRPGLSSTQSSTPQLTSTSVPMTTSEASQTDSSNSGGLLPTLPPSRRKRAVADDSNTKDKRIIKHLNCQNCHCAIFHCYLRNMISGTSVSINVTFSIRLAQLGLDENTKSVRYHTSGVLVEPDHPRFYKWAANSTATVTTNFSTLSQGRIEPWIIIVSAICGLLLLIFLGLIFWKLGFFKRKKKDEVQEFRRQSMRKSAMQTKRPPPTDMPVESPPQ